MSVTAFVPVEVYLKSAEYEPDAEYVDGSIEERPVGELYHGAWQLAICLWFRSHSKAWSVRVVPELRVRVSPTRFRIPDVTVLDRNQLIEQVVTTPPLAVFEVVSPEDTYGRMMRKLQDYALMGVRQIWVVDPETKRWLKFVEGSLIKETEFIHGAIRFDLSEVEKLLDLEET